MAALPYTITAGDDAEAAPVQGNFDALNVRLNSVESIIDNIVVDADTYANGIFPDGLTASTVGTTLSHTSGTAVVNHQTYYKSTLSTDFVGQGAGTYYVELDTAGDADIYTSTDAARTNLNTVVWNGSGFTSFNTNDRNVLATYQEIIDARDGEASLDARLDDIENSQRIVSDITVQTSAALTLDATHVAINCNTTSNGITVTIPLANSFLGRGYLIYVGTHISGNTVTIARSGSDVFISDGTQYTSAILTLYDFVELTSVASGVWLIKNQYGAALS